MRIFALLTALLLTAALPAFAAGKPNVVLIFVDDLGYSDAGAFGSKLHRTCPGLLAREPYVPREGWQRPNHAPLEYLR